MGRSHTELHFEMLTKSFGGRAKHKFCFFATNWHQQARSGRASWGLAPVPSGTGVRVRFPPRPAVEERALCLRTAIIFAVMKGSLAGCKVFWAAPGHFLITTTGRNSVDFF